MFILFSYGSTLNRTLKTYLQNAYYVSVASRTAAQSKTAPNTSPLYMPQTPYPPPPPVHTYSCTLTQKSGSSVCPSTPSSAGAPDEPDAAPGSKQGASGQTIHLQDAALTHTRLCQPRVVEETNGDDGGSVAGSYMPPSSIPSGARDCLRSVTSSVPAL